MRELGVSIILKKKKVLSHDGEIFRIKKDHQDAIVMYRIGDFYEMFFDDANYCLKSIKSCFNR